MDVQKHYFVEEIWMRNWIDPLAPINMYSKCYRDLIMKEAQASYPMAIIEKSFSTGSSMEEEAPLVKCEAKFTEDSRTDLSRSPRF